MSHWERESSESLGDLVHLLGDVGAGAGVRGAPWDPAGGQAGLLRAKRAGRQQPWPPGR